MSARAPAPIALPMRREHVFDPPLELGRLRQEDPVCRLRYRDGQVGWLVADYGLARAVMTDPRFILTPASPFAIEDPAKHAALINADSKIGAEGGNLLLLDPPQHTRLRRAMLSMFTLQRMEALRPAVGELVAKRLDAMERIGPPLDLVETFAAPIALGTHCLLLGLPEEDAELIGRLSGAATNPEADAEAVITVVLGLSDYLRRIVSDKRAQPGDDLTSHLVVSGELSDAEILGVLLMLFAAGVDTAAHMLATGPFALLCHSEQLAALRADPGLIDGAVEELMRFLTIFQAGAITRVAREDVELAGQAIGVGERVTVSLAAANRDPKRFADPDRLDIARSARGQLGFGHGIHVCLGQHLARLEMKIALGELLRRFPTLALAVGVDAVPLTGEQHLIFGVQQLPVTWQQTSAIRRGVLT